MLFVYIYKLSAFLLFFAGGINFFPQLITALICLIFYRGGPPPKYDSSAPTLRGGGKSDVGGGDYKASISKIFSLNSMNRGGYFLNKEIILSIM